MKDKLGNRSNASSEVEFVDAHGVMLGDEGRGVRTIIDMVQHNRYYCASASAGMMRQGLRQAWHHVSHRRAFQRRLLEQAVTVPSFQRETPWSKEDTLEVGVRVSRGNNCV